MRKNRDSMTKFKIFIKHFGAVLWVLFKYIAEIGAVVVAFITSILGFVNILDTDTLLSVFLALFAFVLVYFLTQNNQIKNAHELIDNSFDELRKVLNITQKPSADSVFNNTNDQAEKEIIQNAQSALLLLQETGNLIIEKNKADLTNFLLNGGKLQIVVCSTDIITSKMLAYRNSDLTDVDDFKLRYKNFYHQISSICTGEISRCELAKQVTIRQTPYPVAITAVQNDSNDLIIRYSDFKAAYDEKIDVYINKQTDPKTYEHYANQLQKYYLSSYKKLFVTGIPHSGKTTLFEELISYVEQYYYADCFYYMFSREILNNGERCGYEIISSLSSKPVAFAKKDTFDSEYNINTDVIDKFADEINNNKHKILIIDEVGIMQFASKKFAETIISLVNDNSVTLFATITKDVKEAKQLNQVKNSLYSECHEFTRENHDKMLSMLKNEIAASINMYLAINK